MASIAGSVGKNGQNSYMDSVTVQGLLNNFIAYGWVRTPNGTKVAMLKIDGDPGTKTKDAIEYFQRSYKSEIGGCKFRLIEPNGATFKRLSTTPTAPKGGYASPTEPEEPDDLGENVHVVYSYDQKSYGSLCLALSSKWLRLRGLGKDFLYDPVTKVGEPPSGEVYWAQALNSMGGSFNEDKLNATLAYFHLKQSTPMFEWEKSHIGVQGGTWAAHLVARHDGRFLHLMWGPGGDSHAIAYQVTYKNGKAVMRYFDANTGHVLVQSGAMFVDVVKDNFLKKGYVEKYDGHHLVIRVRSF
jgi:hypothetical protein